MVGRRMNSSCVFCLAFLKLQVLYRQSKHSSDGFMSTLKTKAYICLCINLPRFLSRPSPYMESLKVSFRVDQSTFFTEGSSRYNWPETRWNNNQIVIILLKRCTFSTVPAIENTSSQQLNRVSPKNPAYQLQMRCQNIRSNWQHVLGSKDT